MIITKLQGGLGNQLFQYAAGRFVAEHHQVPLAFDTTALQREDARVIRRDFGLDAFQIEAVLAERREIRAFVSPWRRRLFGLMYLQESGYQFDERLGQAPEEVYLDGFWQNWNYVEPIQDIVRKEIVLKEPLDSYYQNLLRRILGKESIAVHIRRQDYVTNPATNRFHGLLPRSYYEKGATLLAERGVRDPTYVVFSDDIPWCRKNITFGDAPIEFCYPPHSIDTQELLVMSACRHFIIANSSFSWWGAWLRPDPGKIVIAPKKWTNDPNDPNERIVPGWIAL